MLFAQTTKLALAALLAIFLSGCYPAEMSFSPGWATRTISGRMSAAEGGTLPGKPFIVVRSYYSQFIQFGGQAPLYVPKATVVFPDKGGFYRILFDIAATSVDLNFVAEERVMRSFRFERQVGVGDIEFAAELQRTTGWHDHLYVNLAPFLQGFLVESRYELAPIHQQFIGDWLEAQRALVDKTRTKNVIR